MLVDPLKTLPGDAVQTDVTLAPTRSLAELNLIRGLRLGLPSGGYWSGWRRMKSAMPGTVNATTPCSGA